MTNISIVVPCYDEEDGLKLFDSELNRVVSSFDNGKYTFEVTYVDDGSKDSTLDIIKELCGKREYAGYIALSRNFGKEAAMYAGICHAKGDYVCVMDADLQDPPSLLPDIIKILETGEYDSVATRRISREGEPRIRSLSARIFYKLINKISDADIVDGARDFRMMSREMADVIIEMGERNRFSKGIFGWIGFRTYWYPYENKERAAGTTKWSFWKLFKYSIEGIVNFSNVPLDIASWGGIGCTGIALIFIIIIILKKIIFGDPVQGWASTMCAILFLGGIQLFCIGILGQYLGKTYLETKKRPHFIIRESSEDCEQRIK